MPAQCWTSCTIQLKHVERWSFIRLDLITFEGYRTHMLQAHRVVFGLQVQLFSLNLEIAS